MATLIAKVKKHFGGFFMKVSQLVSLIALLPIWQKNDSCAQRSQDNKLDC
jgi:hypothetical protein